MDIHLRSGDRMLKARLEKKRDRIFLQFGYSMSLLPEIKAMRSAMWHGRKPDQLDENGDDPRDPHRRFILENFTDLRSGEPTDKIWSVENCPRNQFQLKFLMGGDPYAPWDRKIEFTPSRPDNRPHQVDLTAGFLAVHAQLWAAEMGVGKTLALIEAMEQSGTTDWWYVGPNSACKAVAREFRKWKAKFTPRMMNYNGLKKEMKEWQDFKKTPHGVCLDEFHHCKGITTQTSQAAQALADGMRHDWQGKEYILGMTGTPAPKSPLDWYSLCEIICPGWLAEGDIHKFTKRLAICEQKEGVAGGQYKKLMWRNSEDKCDICGRTQDDHNYADSEIKEHAWVASKNEVAFLNNRMDPLVKVLFKKDCIQLPEKIYEIMSCKVSPETARMAQLIIAQTPRAAEALIKLRELSDGFQYEDVERGTKKCPLCKGSCEAINPNEKEDGTYEFVPGPCPNCSGTGLVPNVVRTVREVPCPKDELLEDLLEMHMDIGRLIVYAGFQASVDKVERICQSKKWATIRFDGRGIKMLGKDGEIIVAEDDDHFLRIFQDMKDEYERVVFIGQPGAAGQGLTLTASPSIAYFSNTFDGEDRIQSEGRNHRFGCIGANIFDFVHLPTDRYILKNLKEKREMQSMTMGEIIEAMKTEYV